jgi:hypothetical protein
MNGWRAGKMVTMVTVTAGLLAVGASVGSCGRSAESAVNCPAPAADCSELEEQQAAAEAAHAAAPADGEGADVRRDAGECVALLVAEAVVGECVDPCAELCRLHPCPVLDADGVVDVDADCAARCAEVVEADGSVDLDTALARAAQEPAFCTCRGCGAPDDALCTGLFDCAD